MNYSLENKTVFICIGAQKAGTTWLHAALSNYKDIGLPHIKELHYFDVKWLPKKFNTYEIRKLWTKQLKTISENIADTVQNAIINNNEFLITSPLILMPNLQKNMVFYKNTTTIYR